MKTTYISIILLLAGLLYAGCKKIDNYDAPNSGIYGNLTDAENGDPMVLPQGVGQIRMLEVNKKYPLGASPIGLNVNSSSAYYATQLFADQYLVFPLAQSGPFIYPSNDSVLVTLHPGKMAQVNFQVIPFYRITASVQDTTVTYTITSSDANTALGAKLTNIYVMINADSSLTMSTADNLPGTYYANRFPISGVSNTLLGVPQTFIIPFSTTHLAPGTYYFRVSCTGSKSSSQYNYSKVIESTVN